MKVNFALMLLGIASAVHFKSINLNEETGASLDDTLDGLMDKYETQDKKPKVDAKKKVESKNGPSIAQVTDMEYNILSGNVLETSSAKAEEDDVYMEVLNRYATENKNKERILTKDNAQEACTEIYSTKKEIDTYDAMDKVKATFAKVWKEHDINNKGNIDFNEGYSLVQDIVRDD